MKEVKDKSKGSKKAFIIGGVVLLLLAGASYGVYYVVKRKKRTGSYMGGGGSGGSSKRASSGRSDGSSKRTSTGTRYTNKSYPLRYGTYHPDVKVLQRYLKATYNANLGRYGKNKDGVDGKFGNATKNAAIKHLKKQVFTEKDIAGMKAALKIIKA